MKKARYSWGDLSVTSNSHLVEILDTKFDVSRNSLLMQIRFDQKIVYISILCL